MATELNPFPSTSRCAAVANSLFQTETVPGSQDFRWLLRECMVPTVTHLQGEDKRATGGLKHQPTWPAALQEAGTAALRPHCPTLSPLCPRIISRTNEWASNRKAVKRYSVSAELTRKTMGRDLAQQCHTCEVLSSILGIPKENRDT